MTSLHAITIIIIIITITVLLYCAVLIDGFKSQRSYVLYKTSGKFITHQQEDLQVLSAMTVLYCNYLSAPHQKVLEHTDGPM